MKKILPNSKSRLTSGDSSFAVSLQLWHLPRSCVGRRSGRSRYRLCVLPVAASPVIRLANPNVGVAASIGVWGPFSALPPRSFSFYHDFRGNASIFLRKMKIFLPRGFLGRFWAFWGGFEGAGAGFGGAGGSLGGGGGRIWGGISKKYLTGRGYGM